MNNSREEDVLKPNIYVIGGPTASGKSKLAVELAKRINGEIISADSMQIYKDMNIGTAKLTKEEMQGIKHHLLDFVSPEERYSVANFKTDAKIKIEEILKKGKTPIIVGGTGLYIDSMIYGIEFQDEKIDKEYREELNELAEKEGLERLYEEARKIDSEAMKKISINDKKRIIRVLEIYHKTGKTKTEVEKESRKNEIKYNYKMFAITMNREKLYERIEKRVDQMIEQGLIEEVQSILNKYHKFPTAMQGLGYKEVVEYLENKLTKEEMIEKIKKKTRHYAKRQLTWFKKNKETIWLDGEKPLEKNLEIIINGE
jgi:tRNA dimethylallyltransferase